MKNKNPFNPSIKKIKPSKIRAMVKPIFMFEPSSGAQTRTSAAERSSEERVHFAVIHGIAREKILSRSLA